MKIQCDVCERAPATVICCADEAALCRRCDVEVHEANKLASKHPRLLLHCLSRKPPPCDICRDKAAFIFCVEDRALFCKDCDESIHSASLAANHQRLLATGIRVALSSKGNKPNESSHSSVPPPVTVKTKTTTPQAAAFESPSWTDDLLQFTDFETFEKREQRGFAELEWLPEMDIFESSVDHGAFTTTEVPQLPISQPSNLITKSHKKQRIEISDDNDDDDDDELFTVPNLG